MIADASEYPMLRSQDVTRGEMPSKAPTVIVTLYVALTAVLMWSNAAGYLHLLFPAASVAVGIYLYRRNPTMYVSLTLWLWFLCPFVRRVVDYRSYWLDANPILITPALVAAISVAALPAKVNRLWRSSALPFLLVAVGTTIGLAVGVAMGNAKDAAATYLLWIAPLCFGLYIQLFPANHEQMRKAVSNAFVGFVLIAGAYGLFQFITAPAWDCFWLERVSENSVDPSFGHPEPFGIRVWSTLNAPGPFSVALMVGLVILFAYKGLAKMPAMLIGYAAFLLTLVRTSWLSWMIALPVIMYFNRRSLMRLIGPIAVLLALGACLTQYPPAAEKINERLASAAAIGSDESALERKHLYDVLPGYLLTHPMGRGLSNSPTFEGLALDSGLLSTPLQLGWFGTGLVSIGLLLQLKRSRLPKSSFTFERACQISALAIVLQVVGTQLFSGVNAFLLWTLLGVCCSGAAERES